MAQVQVKEADEIEAFDRNLELAPGEKPVSNTARLRQLMGGAGAPRRRRRGKPKAPAGGSFE